MRREGGQLKDVGPIFGGGALCGCPDNKKALEESTVSNVIAHGKTGEHV